MHLSFGRKSGLGGRYPKDMQIGARVFLVTPDGIETWIRQADLTVSLISEQPKL